MPRVVNWIPAFAGMAIILFLLFLPTTFARTTPNDYFQASRAEFEAKLAKISTPGLREKMREGDQILRDINQAVCQRFEADVTHLAAIMDEVRSRQGITQTVVAFGTGNTQIEKADYWINYAAEAIAYQKIQDYTPNIGVESALKSSLVNSEQRLNSALGVLRDKVLKAKTQVGQVFNYVQ